MGRIWLLPAMFVRKTVCGDGIRRSNSGGGRWLKGVKEANEEKKAKKAKTQKAYGGIRNPRPHTYTPMEGQWADKKVGTVATFNDLT
jgi:hypothetical protein